MSGGVDSSVAAALLIEAGFDVTGGFIKNWSDTKDLWTGECAWRGERRDALRVAATLPIPLLTFDFEKEYRERVLKRLFDGYAQGVTPNPDVLCNEEIKFGLFFDEAMRLGFDAVATGHYARVTTDDDGVAHLWKGVDPDKDQSYFLHRIHQQRLRRTLFPIGEYTKITVRALATERRLPTAQKADSQGICFLGKLDFHDFLRKKIPPSPGEIVTPEGEVIGHHDGLDAATIGQRQGLGIAKDRRAWYVAKKDQAHNRLIVVSDRNHPLLFASSVRIDDVTWIRRTTSRRFSVMTRYRQPPTLATYDGETQTIAFDDPVWAPAAGQSAVLYEGDECVGGGVMIEEPLHFSP